MFTIIGNFNFVLSIHTFTYVLHCFNMASSVHWYGHVLRKYDGHVLRRVLDFEVQGQRKKGRPKRTWKKQVEEESVKVVLIR